MAEAIHIHIHMESGASVTVSFNKLLTCNKLIM